MIDVPSSSPSSIQDMPNRLLLAVSDAASAGVISGGTVWTFYFVQQNTVGGGDTLEYLDFPSLGVDNNALYVGGDMFTASTGAFTGSSVFVIRKTTALSGGPLVTTAFRGLVPNPATSEGMLDPRGMDNYNPTANEGYFIGTSNLLFGELVMRRISTPGGTPAISADILIPVNATAFPIPVDHLGNTGGIAGRLESIDDRLFAAHIRNGRLWTAHNIAVDATGVASNGPARRTAVRWYKLNVPVGSGTPTWSSQARFSTVPRQSRMRDNIGCQRRWFRGRDMPLLVLARLALRIAQMRRPTDASRAIHLGLSARLRFTPLAAQPTTRLRILVGLTDAAGGIIPSPASIPKTT